MKRRGWLWLSLFSLVGVAAGGSSPAVCETLKVPAQWDVRRRVYADVTGDGEPECVLSVWRPWQDWPIARWSAHPTPITVNQDRFGYSSHIAVLKPLHGGTYRNVWVGSALYQPVTDIAIMPDGTLAALETTYQRGRWARSVALSRWHWTGFGFGIVNREPGEGTELHVTPDGELQVR